MAGNALTKAEEKTTGPRRALGRGLNALMSPVAVEGDLRSTASSPTRAGRYVEQRAAVSDRRIETPASRHEEGLLSLDIESIVPNEAQPRQSFPQDALNSLAHSIRDTGLLQPILVRPLPSGGEASYEIVAGERRWRAAQEAGLHRIPAILKDLSDREALELGIVENVQRSDLNPIEEAEAYRKLLVDFGASQSEIAATVSKDRVSVANSLRLLRLPSDIQVLLVEGKLSAGHGRALLMLDSEKDQKRLAKKIIEEGLSVRALEHLVSGEDSKRKTGPRRSRSSDSKAPGVLELENRLRRALGTKVSLSLDKAHKGELKISFFSKDELESLLERLGA